MALRILVRGGGDLASGVVLRLHRAGWQVIVTELPLPLAVRRYVSFAQALLDGRMTVEDVQAERVDSLAQIQSAWSRSVVPVIADPGLDICQAIHPHVLIDARMLKRAPETGLEAAPLVVGLGPGFTAGLDCHAVVETNRGPFLGRVIWSGAAEQDTRVPEQVAGHQGERVLRAPAGGRMEPVVNIGSLVHSGDLIARVGGQAVIAPFSGVVRGLLLAGLPVQPGDKIGDLDPRGDTRLCWLVSDKALAVGGGVLEIILSWQPLRPFLWEGGEV